MVRDTDDNLTRWPAAGAISPADEIIVSQVTQSLERGVRCKNWWQQTHANDAYAYKFPLVRTFNRPDNAFGFFDYCPLDGVALPVMGSVVEETYDWSKSDEVANWDDEFREFVLRYFLRVSDFRLPETYVDERSGANPPFLNRFCWCERKTETRTGFGYSQVYFKDLPTGRIGKFPVERQYQIADLRQVGIDYEWLVLDVGLFDFNLQIRPLGSAGPELRIPLHEHTLVIVGREFIEDIEAPAPGVARRVGFGYAVLRPIADSGLIAYGPGRFDFGFSQFVFSVLTTGETKFQGIFVVNRPQRVLNVALNPLDFAGQLLSLMAPDAQEAGTPTRIGTTVDPLLGFITLANVFTGGLAGRLCCISREQLEKQMLIQHFVQNYQMISGSLSTWRKTADWRDPISVPDWATSGISS